MWGACWTRSASYCCCCYRQRRRPGCLPPVGGRRPGSSFPAAGYCAARPCSCTPGYIRTEADVQRAGVKHAYALLALLLFVTAVVKAARRVLPPPGGGLQQRQHQQPGGHAAHPDSLDDSRGGAASSSSRAWQQLKAQQGQQQLLPVPAAAAAAAAAAATIASSDEDIARNSGRRAGADEDEIDSDQTEEVYWGGDEEGEGEDGEESGSGDAAASASARAAAIALPAGPSAAPLRGHHGGGNTVPLLTSGAARHVSSLLAAVGVFSDWLGAHPDVTDGAVDEHLSAPGQKAAAGGAAQGGRKAAATPAVRGGRGRHHTPRGGGHLGGGGAGATLSVLDGNSGRPEVLLSFARRSVLDALAGLGNQLVGVALLLARMSEAGDVPRLTALPEEVELQGFTPMMMAHPPSAGSFGASSSSPAASSSSSSSSSSTAAAAASAPSAGPEAPFAHTSSSASEAVEEVLCESEVCSWSAGQDALDGPPSGPSPATASEGKDGGGGGLNGNSSVRIDGLDAAASAILARRVEKVLARVTFLSTRPACALRSEAGLRFFVGTDRRPVTTSSSLAKRAVGASTAPSASVSTAAAPLRLLTRPTVKQPPPPPPTVIVTLAAAPPVAKAAAARVAASSRAASPPSLQPRFVQPPVLVSSASDFSRSPERGLPAPAPPMASAASPERLPAPPGAAAVNYTTSAVGGGGIVGGASRALVNPLPSPSLPPGLHPIVTVSSGAVVLAAAAAVRVGAATHTIPPFPVATATTSAATPPAAALAAASSSGTPRGIEHSSGSSRVAALEDLLPGEFIMPNPSAPHTSSLLFGFPPPPPHHAHHSLMRVVEEPRLQPISSVPSWQHQQQQQQQQLLGSHVALAAATAVPPPRSSGGGLDDDEDLYRPLSDGEESVGVAAAAAAAAAILPALPAAGSTASHQGDVLMGDVLLPRAVGAAAGPGVAVSPPFPAHAGAVAATAAAAPLVHHAQLEQLQVGALGLPYQHRTVARPPT